MGLDMFLNKRTHIYNDELQNKIKIEGLPPEIKINPKKIKSITEEMMYWRKANSIHQWFVKHAQHGEDSNDGSEHHVSRSQLQELLTTINEVLEDRCLARRLLPTQPGFFFGETDYDEYYFENLKETQKMLVEALKEPEPEGVSIDYIYESSW